MFKSYNTNKVFFGLALLTTIGFESFNSVLGRNYQEIAINAHRIELKKTTLLKQQDKIATLAIVINPISAVSKLNQSNVLKYPLQAVTSSSIFFINTTINSNQNKAELNNNLSLNIVRIVSLSFFLLLFVPFGIFYPFFLFYKRILKINNQSVIKLARPDSVSAPEPLIVKKSNNEDAEKKYQGIISKLQIACTAPAHNLRQKLVQINSDLVSEIERESSEVMQQTIAILLEQNNWTHCGSSSVSFPLAKITKELEVIYSQEKNKFINREISDNYRYPTSHNYVVVTLIICTSSPALLEQIYTKEQLVNELTQLSKLKKEYLIKFDLLWNPQIESEYITNHQLLKEYSGLIRLF